jgi:two-component system, NarL family, response regulator DesR
MMLLRHTSTVPALAAGAPERWPHPENAIRVLLAEQQTMVREALSALLRLEGDLEVVAEVMHGDEIVPAALATCPDVALLGLELSGDGLGVVPTLRAAAPTCRIIVLTTTGRAGHLRHAMDGGASGFLVKDAPMSELAMAIRRVMAGESVVDPLLALAALSAGRNPLTPRERDVLRLASRGAPVAEIAARLFLADGTVRNYVSLAIQKVGARNRIEAARIAEEKGWL